MPIDTRKVDHELARWRALRNYIQLDGTCADDDQLLLDTMEGATDLPEMIQQLLLESRMQTAFAKAAKALAVETGLRSVRHDHKAERFKQMAMTAMQSAGMDRLPDNGLVSASITDGEPELIYDEERIKQDGVYVRIKSDVDREGIRKAFKERNFLVPGVTLGNAKPRFNVRYK